MLLDSENSRLANSIASRQLDHFFLGLTDESLADWPTNKDDSHLWIVILFLREDQRLGIAGIALYETTTRSPISTTRSSSMRKSPAKPG